MAIKDITCQTCKKSVLSNGFYHETGTLAMKCSNCNGMIFPTTKADEDSSRSILRGSPNYSQKNELLPIKIAPATRTCANEYLG